VARTDQPSDESKELGVTPPHRDTICAMLEEYAAHVSFHRLAPQLEDLSQELPFHMASLSRVDLYLQFKFV
jgi:hypothetical protein